MDKGNKFERDVYFLKETSYLGNHPNFFNKNDFTWVKYLEDNYTIICDEIINLINDKETLPENLNPPYLSSPGAWRNFYFMNFRWYDHENCLKYPKTFALLMSVPHISFGGITVLNPHSRVLPHIGETNATIRCHLGLSVPGKNLDCGIMVNGEKRAHQTGKVVLFSDAHIHTTWNDTDERRVILVFDVVQKEFTNKSDWVCANALGALTIKYLDEKIPLVKQLPSIVLQALHKSLSFAWRIYLPIQKKFKYFYILRRKIDLLFYSKKISLRGFLKFC